MTTETLEDYLAGDYHQDKEDIRELEETLERTVNVFIHSCRDGVWPYERRSQNSAHRAAAPNGVSHGTQAMIGAALGKVCGLNTMPSGDRAHFKLAAAVEEDLRAVQGDGVKCLLASLDTGDLQSRTFGRNDPVTLSHVTELIRGANDAGFSNIGSNLAHKVRNAIAELADLAGCNPSDYRQLIPHLPDYGSKVDDQPPIFRQPDYVVNGFVPLRIVRSVGNLSAAGIELGSQDGATDANLESAKFDPYRRYFESTLHDQLSFSAIPDSRFDAAELIFCLEGLMLCARHAIDSRVFEHVIHVLKEKQEISAQWRPNRPIFATPQGMTMLPVSVESAVSLVRSVEIIDRRQSYHPFSGLAVPLARRFWRWLRARMVQFPAAEASTSKTSKYSDFTGWHSEHVNDPGLIHLWDTSQVLEFMLGYREMLQRSIAGRTLLLSRLKIDVPARKRPKDWRTKWVEQAAVFEPRRGKGDKVYECQLTNDFVLPWGQRDPKNFSILLYGPPGTGKSTLAENLAKALGMRMITVTVSDFLGRGGANVEARAKAIFETLEAQFDAVILFDEIDSFLLDRDGSRYREQDSLFQFLTPGMLTKINDLRKKERSIFIIATNYANRIDPAIKRRGRIDQRYLLQLPDAEKRLEIIRDLRKGVGVTENLQQEVRKHTLFFGYSDLVSVVKAGGNGGTDADLLAALKSGDYQPSTTIEAYLVRYPEENFPFDELFELAKLKVEVQPDFDIHELQILRGGKEDRDKFKSDLAGAVSQLLQENGGGGDLVLGQNPGSNSSEDRNGADNEESDRHEGGSDA